MKIHCPGIEQIPALQRLWETAFQEDDGFLDAFYSTAFSPGRCICAETKGHVAAALYWLEASCTGQPLAYLYAVATDPAYRNRGLCRAIMAAAEEKLKGEGVQGILLVPAEPGLAQMYEKMGYGRCTSVDEFSCKAAGKPAPMERVDAAEFARLRRKLLPPAGVIQEGETLALLSTQAEFYAGADFLAAVCREGAALRGVELLGNRDAAPGILRGLGYDQGVFRMPGEGRPFAYFKPLSLHCPVPGYFGLALD